MQPTGSFDGASSIGRKQTTLGTFKRIAQRANGGTELAHSLFDNTTRGLRRWGLWRKEFVMRVESTHRSELDRNRLGRRSRRHPDSERRDAPRLPGRVRFSAGRSEGSGLIEDLSLSGAHVAEASCSPELGTRVRLFFATNESETPLYAFGTVVRRSPASFVLRFQAVEPNLQGFLLAAGSASSCSRGAH